jgi:hypothetical protein
MLNKEENEKIWRERVAEYRASNQTQKQWCTQNNYKQTTLRYWLEKISKEQAKKEMPEWIDLEVGENKVAKMPVKKLEGNIIEVSIGKVIITFPVTAEVKINIC